MKEFGLEDGADGFHNYRANPRTIEMKQLFQNSFPLF